MSSGTLQIKTTIEGEPTEIDAPPITVSVRNEADVMLEFGPYNTDGLPRLAIMIEHHDISSPVGAGWHLYLYGKDDEPVRIDLDDDGNVVVGEP